MLIQVKLRASISCDGATSDLHLNVKLYRGEYSSAFLVYNAVNDELITETQGYWLNQDSYFTSQLEIKPDYADKIRFLDLSPTVYDGDFVANASSSTCRSFSSGFNVYRFT